jgi:hypothetical protein
VRVHSIFKRYLQLPSQMRKGELRAIRRLIETYFKARDSPAHICSALQGYRTALAESSRSSTSLP